MSKLRAPTKTQVDSWVGWAKSEQPPNTGGGALAEWRALKRRAKENLLNNGLDLSGKLYDWAREAGYKEPK